MSQLFRVTFCDPFKPDLQELGEMDQEHFLQVFNSIPWADFLRQMNTRKENEIYFSPSLTVEIQESKHGVSVSAVGEPEEYEFYIFYNRPKVKKYLGGLFSRYYPDYLTDITEQTKQDALDCFNAFYRNDFPFLDRKIR